MKNNKQLISLKRLISILVDIALIMVGIVLIPLGICKWEKTGFVFELKNELGLKEGNEALLILGIGVLLLAYGIIDYFIFRKK